MWEDCSRVADKCAQLFRVNQNRTSNTGTTHNQDTPVRPKYIFEIAFDAVEGGALVVESNIKNLISNGITVFVYCNHHLCVVHRQFVSFRFCCDTIR